MSFDLDDQDTREDIRRMVATSEAMVEFANNAELIRQVRHHDVLCLVLKCAMQSWLLSGDREHKEQAPHALVNFARIAANLAYPPPKAEGT